MRYECIGKNHDLMGMTCTDTRLLNHMKLLHKMLEFFNPNEVKKLPYLLALMGLQEDGY